MESQEQDLNQISYPSDIENERCGEEEEDNNQETESDLPTAEYAPLDNPPENFQQKYKMP